MENQNDINKAALDFDFHPASENHSIIKVVGVGGGGGNAVQNMYETGIQDVSFLIINTDKQALKGSVIPNQLLISEKGLGAGAKPEVAHDFAVQYSEAIRQALSDGTEMAFITAGMGGGTGTGAAPVVAQIAHEMNILTIGIVTIPFRFEGRKKMLMALEGVRSIEKWCDALLVVNNNRLIDIFPDLTFGNAFLKADETLSTAAKSISDIINKQGYINLDFADVSTTLRNGGVALISTGVANGEGRLSKAIDKAITSPLLQDNKISDAKHLLFELCFSHNNPISMAEMTEMNEFVERLNGDIEVIWGAMYDDSLGDDVRIILLASGFAMDHTTGAITAGNNTASIVKKMQTQLRQIVESRLGLLNEFHDYPEAAEILSNACREAAKLANVLTIDNNIDDEVARLDEALIQARAKKQEAIDTAARKAREEEEARQAAIRAQIEALTAQLKGTSVPAPVVTVTPETVETPEPQPEEMPTTVVSEEIFSDKEFEAEVQSPEVVSETETAEAPVIDQPIVAEAPKAPISTHEPTPTATVTAPEPFHVTPASSVQEGLEEIRHFYGEETANRIMLDETRKAYCILDDKELTNEELIERLEHLPAYNRTLEDLGQLRAVSAQPAKPRVIGSPDGTIQF